MSYPNVVRIGDSRLTRTAEGAVSSTVSSSSISDSRDLELRQNPAEQWTPVALTQALWGSEDEI